jgi:hypothetical protein
VGGARKLVAFLAGASGVVVSDVRGSRSGEVNMDVGRGYCGLGGNNKVGEGLGGVDGDGEGGGGEVHERGESCISSQESSSLRSSTSQRCFATFLCVWQA